LHQSATFNPLGKGYPCLVACPNLRASDPKFIRPMASLYVKDYAEYGQDCFTATTPCGSGTFPAGWVRPCKAAGFSPRGAPDRCVAGSLRRARTNGRAR